MSFCDLGGSLFTGRLTHRCHYEYVLSDGFPEPVYENSVPFTLKPETSERFGKFPNYCGIAEWYAPNI
jgi:hypothetical protein